MSKLFEALQRSGATVGDLISQEPFVVDLGPRSQTAEAARAGHHVNGGSAAAPGTEPLANGCLDGIHSSSLRVRDSAPLLPFGDNHWQASEQYRIIRTRILQHPDQPRVIIISSAGPGDGKSVTSINLAGVFSLKTDMRVVLVDADLRRSKLHQHLGIRSGPGLAEVLAGECTLNEALVQTSEFPNLYILPAGKAIANPAELLDSSRWTSIAAELRAGFQYVFLDSCPVAAVADFDLLQAVADGVVIVVRPDHTDRKLCLKAIELVPKNKLVGVVLNCVERWFITEAYGYNYYKYY